MSRYTPWTQRVLLLVALLVLPAVASAQQAETIEYYGTDAIGSIRIVWNANGTMIARQDFMPFGEPVLQQGTAIPKEGFVGNETDAETNQDYFHARMFEARTGRFTRTDPVEDGVGEPQRWNRYSYALNNPLAVEDWNGFNAEAPDCFDIDLGGGTTGHFCGSLSTGVTADAGGGGWDPTWNDSFMSSSQAWSNSLTSDQNGRDHSGGATTATSTTTTAPPPGTPPVDPPDPGCDPKTGNGCTPPTNPASDFWDGTKDAWNKGYFNCLAKQNIPGFGAAATVHAAGDAAVHAAGHFSPKVAGAYYHATDGRFKAWGKCSKVLVPRLSETIEVWAERLGAVGLGYADYELFKSIGECSDTLY